ncbi:hypothetical protein QVD17_29556 [Tagetes erecta]|uniref:Uncharacterized protein n=1 Tax=Tagetes erecta TaxID=13708 RepID=A0AAD8NF91_TARER|nr:hypothetical protein QVD17_29556 [Tagetes erecta]
MAIAKQQFLPSLYLSSKFLSISRATPNSVCFSQQQSQPWGLKSKKKKKKICGAVEKELFVVAADAVGYSSASYYTSLGLFVISVPGLWSLIKRSVKSKVVKKTFVQQQEEGTLIDNKSPNQVAGEILSFFTRNNFSVVDTGDTITFEGVMVPSRGQAALLTFCTCISLASVALVLTITIPDLGNNWFAITILSPLAGLYYWKRASRKEQIKVRMMLEEDGSRLSEIIVQGDDQQIDQMRKDLNLTEKGMVYVKGIFETS